MKSILITSTDLMMVQFLMPHVKNLSNLGYNVDIACSNVGNRLEEVKIQLNEFVENIFEVRLARNPLSTKNLKGYRDLLRIFDKRRYDLVWTNEPVMGVMTRLTANKYRKKGTKVLYMAHGFHFFKGAPILNWLLYYPIEYLMSAKTDVIATVNTEDYNRARAFKAPKVSYIHGIGINTERLSGDGKSTDIRKELALDDDDFLLLSIGELNKNKNQKIIIEALEKLNNKKIKYILCGKGAELENLKKLSARLQVEDQVFFLGYRKDVVDICSQCDVYVMPSYREGLPVSSLEAMYCGLPLITSDIRGLNDVNKEGVNGYLCSPQDIEGFAYNIQKLYDNPKMREKMKENNKRSVVPYKLSQALIEVLSLVNSLHESI